MLPSFTTVPHIPADSRKLFWGKRRVAVGGRTVGDEGDSDSEDDDDSDKDKEPPEIILPPTSGGASARSAFAKSKIATALANYHHLPGKVYDSLGHMFSCQVRLDLTPGDGSNAVDSICVGVAYVGCCQTEYQKEFIERQLMEKVMAEMQNPTNSHLYSAAYCKWKQGEAAKVSTEVGKKLLTIQ